MGRRLLALGLSGALTLAAASQRAFAEEPVAPPLPDLRVFVGQVRDRLHTDEFLLDQYTFTERHTERQLDDKGKIRKVSTSVYEVYPSPMPGRTYRRLIEKDGKSLSIEELSKEDRKQDEKDAKAAAKVAAAQAERHRKEAEVIEELLRVYDIRIVGRERLDGRASILVVFRPWSNVEPANKAGKILQRFAGRAWIDEEDRQLVRVEAELVDDLSFGLGILAKLKKGSTAFMLRRKINDEIWLPAEARFVGQARILLVKSLRLDSLSEYSDYKKFSVATESAVTSEEKKD